MPVLDDIFPASEITLPVSGAKVKVKYQYTLDEGEAIAEAGNRQSRVMTVLAIKAWDVTDKEGQPLPISDETVGKLPNKDVVAILTWITKRLNKDAEKETQAEKPAEEPTPQEQPLTA